ncbi:MAG: NAD-dependent epimerase/dehydratase family protein [Pseudomonadota bacterium]|nr:NAD-dependent epimerase/dehydratase family protein [Pseudomonadota bacterium]
MGRKKVLVIGGSGFVGQALVSLLTPFYSVYVLGRGRHPVLSAGTRLLSADRYRPEQLYAVAAAAGPFDTVVDICPSHRPDTENVWNAFSAGASHWISISSVAVYRRSPGLFPAEGHPVGGSRAWGDYGRGKSRSDEFLIQAVSGRTAAVTIFRPVYLYGPRNSFYREAFVWDRIASGQDIVVPGRGQAPAQFLHVQDLARAVVLALRKPPSRLAVYNIAGDEIISLGEWVEMLADIAGAGKARIRNMIFPGHPFPFADVACCADTAAVRQQLRWEPDYPLREGFAQTFLTWTPAATRSAFPPAFAAAAP